MPDKEKLHPEVTAFYKKIGALGGKARVEKTTLRQRKNYGRKGAIKRWGEKKEK